MYRRSKAQRTMILQGQGTEGARHRMRTLMYRSSKTKNEKDTEGAKCRRSKLQKQHTSITEAARYIRSEAKKKQCKEGAKNKGRKANIVGETEGVRYRTIKT